MQILLFLNIMNIFFRKVALYSQAPVKKTRSGPMTCFFWDRELNVTGSGNAD